MFEPREFPPPSATVQVTFGAQSRRGHSRAVNEDHYLILRLGRHQETLFTSLPDGVIGAPFDEYGYALVVADGTGGGAGGGEVASHLAIATLVYLVRHFGKWNLRIDDGVAREIMARAERFYRHIDTTVKHQRDAGSLRPDRTTLTATFGAGNDLFFAHVGHSRAYLLRDGHLLRLTRDHTLAAGPLPATSLVDITRTTRDHTHIVTDTIGMSGSAGPRIDIERFHLCDDDRVLVCTNGLTDTVDEGSIESSLSTDESPDAQSRRLVDLAMAAGAEDDATALVAHYRLPR